MANKSISFSCPACGILLTVPASLAGVIGPCPSCRSRIHAPYSADLSAPAPVLAQIVPPPVTVLEMPAAPVPKAAASPPGTPTSLKLELPQLPSLAHPAETDARQMPEPKPEPEPEPKPEPEPEPKPEPKPEPELKPKPKLTGASRQAPLSPLPSRTSTANPLVRFLKLILFLVALGVLFYGVLTMLKIQREKNSPTARMPAVSESPKMEKAAPKPEPSGTGQNQDVPSLPPPPAEQPTLIKPAPGFPYGFEPKSPRMEALAVLEKFLVAKSLPERLPMMETKTPPGELAMSCLAGPLPPAPNMLLEFQESNPLEEVVDFYFSVDFEIPGQAASPQTILLRACGRNEPKVVVDPFLDLFGGRLAAYAARPNDRAGVFQVIASPLATCTDPNIPNREKKLTLKLLARDNTKEIAAAYFGKMSKIGEMLEDGTYSLGYGRAKACTVMLRWNTEDDVNQPYLEAVAIKTLDWNP